MRFLPRWLCRRRPRRLAPVLLSSLEQMKIRTLRSTASADLVKSRLHAASAARGGILSAVEGAMSRLYRTLAFAGFVQAARVVRQARLDRRAT